jgi:hypothetical protein
LLFDAFDHLQRMAASIGGTKICSVHTCQIRREIAAIMARVPAAQGAAIVVALMAFREAAGQDDVALAVPW